MRVPVLRSMAFLTDRSHSVNSSSISPGRGWGCYSFGKCKMSPLQTGAPTELIEAISTARLYHELATMVTYSERQL